MKLFVGSIVCALALAGCGAGSGGSSGDAAFGLDSRQAATTVQIPAGNGATTSLRAVDAGLGSYYGTTMLTNAGDGSNRLFLARKDGVITVIYNRNSTLQSATLLDLSASVDDSTGESGLLGLAFDPAFRSNGYFYVTYVTYAPRKWRLSRFTMSSANANVAAANSEKVVFEFDHPNGDHFGGWIGFGADGLLYMSSGDGGNQPMAQVGASFFGKVLRIRVNANGSYTVPADNPSIGGAVTATWAMGFRNPWRCSFDRGTGNLWCGDVGEASREEVNLIRKGGNYGWPLFEGDRSFENPTSRAYSEFVPATYVYSHDVGVAIIGGYVYRGSTLGGMTGRYLFGDYASLNLWAMTTDGSGAFTGIEVAAVAPLTLQALGEDESGEFFAAPSSGPIYRFETAASAGTGGTMPATLSATGLFRDLGSLTAAPGLIDYEPNSPFWSDGALKRRWVLLPGTQTVDFSATGAWSFPVGTITVKHLELTKPGGGTTRVETRVMVNRPDGWTGYTYRWRADQSDADLMVSGGSATYDTINPASGAKVSLTWNFPSQAQCQNCHTQSAGRVLGLNTLQLNGSHTYAATGRGDNQLRALNHIGIFGSDIGAASQYSAMPNPTDASASLEGRAKAYLDTNCAVCHRPGGPTPVEMDLRYTTALADMQLIGVANQGSVNGVRVVAGNHTGSLLWQRANSTNGNVRMPPLGVQMVDEQGLQQLASWIDALK